MTLRLLPLGAWLLLGVLVFVTLAPIGLRPVSGAPVSIERFGAYALVGLAFALAYPRHIILIAVLVQGSAVALEALQLLVETRHARFGDVILKLLGGLIGIGLGRGLARLRGAGPGPAKNR